MHCLFVRIHCSYEKKNQLSSNSNIKAKTSELHLTDLKANIKEYEIRTDNVIMNNAELINLFHSQNSEDSE